MSQFNRVVKFNSEILGIAPREKGLQSKDELHLSIRQLSEEVNEFVVANISTDYIGAIDALLDLKIFTDGILYKLGLTNEEVDACHKAIMDCNMAKKIGVKKGREGFNSADAIKPDDWKGPEDRIAEIIGGIK